MWIPSSDNVFDASHCFCLATKHRGGGSGCTMFSVLRRSLDFDPDVDDSYFQLFFVSTL